MLRITRSETGANIWLRLEGKLLGPWVDEFRATIAGEASHIERIKLDLHEVTFVDAEGLRFLRELIVDGYAIPNRSNFVAELLRTEVSP